MHTAAANAGSGTTAGGTTPASSLVVQTSFLGDVVLTTPLIAELATRGTVDVVVTPAAAPLLANNPAIRRLITYDKRRSDAGLGGLRRAAARIRSREQGPPATNAYVVQRSLRSGALALLGGCRQRVGFSRSPGTPMYTQRIAYRDDLHHVERIWRLAFPEGAAPPASPERLRPRLHPGTSDHEAVDALLAVLGDSDFVALAPGSVWATKRWPYYAELASRIAVTHPVVVIGSSADSALAAAIRDAVRPGAALDATGKLSLLGSAELIRRASLLVTNDSSPLHLASAMGTPTLAIFGPTVPEFGFGPLAPKSITAGHDSLACRPCHKHGPQQCPLGHWRCMRELTADHLHHLALRALS